MADACGEIQSLFSIFCWQLLHSVLFYVLQGGTCKTINLEYSDLCHRTCKRIPGSGTDYLKQGALGIDILVGSTRICFLSNATFKDGKECL